MFEQRLWNDQSPLWQFVENGKQRLIQRVEELQFSVDRIRETDVNELGGLLFLFDISSFFFLLKY